MSKEDREEALDKLANFFGGMIGGAVAAKRKHKKDLEEAGGYGDIPEKKRENHLPKPDNRVLVKKK